MKTKFIVNRLCSTYNVLNQIINFDHFNLDFNIKYKVFATIITIYNVLADWKFLLSLFSF